MTAPTNTRTNIVHLLVAGVLDSTFQILLATGDPVQAVKASFEKVPESLT